MHPDVLGWAATVVLIATLVRQMIKQWQSPHPETVSKWLFVGQMTASTLSPSTVHFWGQRCLW